MATPTDSPESLTKTKRYTYGRKTAGRDLQQDKSLLFDSLRDEEDDHDATSTSARDGIHLVDWRQRVAELDNASEEEESEDHLADAVRRLRAGNTRTAPPVVATSSLTSLSTVPASSPSKPHGKSRSPSAEPKRSEQPPANGDDPDLRPPQDMSPSPPGSDLTVAPSVPKGGPKALSKADQQQMHKDIAQAERERPVHLSRPEQRFKPVTAWLKNASIAVDPSSSPGPGHESDDIRQFTPSSAVKQDPQESSAPLIPPSSSPSRSSPTLQSKRGPSKFPRFGATDVDDEEEITLDGILTKASKRRDLNARKQAALAKQRQQRAALGEEDDDSLDIVVSPSKPQNALAGRHAPDARAIFDRTARVPAPTRQKQQLLQWSGKHKPKRAVTETHAEFAAQQFGHADLRRANGGSRPAGQKQGRDEVVEQAQVNDNLLRRHQHQVTEIAKQKEAKYGGSRQLPPKESLAAVQLQSDAGSQASVDSDSDEDYVDRQSVASSDNKEDDGLHTETHEDTTVDRRVSLDHEPEDIVQEVISHANDLVNLDDDDDVITPKFKRPKARGVRRVEFESDDEGVGPDPEPETHAEAAIASQPSAPAPTSPELAGFGSTGGGFSQLFGETQQEQPDNNDDAFAGLRHQDGGLFPPTAALLPSVNISESQALRDKALIAGEAAAGTQNGAVPEEAKEQLYLNSQGFFTQTRPADRNSPSKDPVAPDSSVTADEGSGKVSGYLPSSTVLNSDPHVEGSPTQPSFARLRRRLSTDSTRSRKNDDAALGTAQSSRTNAFDLLRDGAREASKKKRSDFVDEQAEESDEDSGWFFPGRHGEEEDDEDAGDEEGYLKELVDDAALSDEEKSRVAMQAAEKHRELIRQDDARMEAEAKKMTEGYYRRKRHGNDFMSDEEEENQKSRRLSKKQRRQRKLDREDGLYKIGGEENKFLEAYEAGLDSDVDFEETPASPGDMTSPISHRLTAQERDVLLRDRGRANRDIAAAVFKEDDDDDVSKSFAISRRKRGPNASEHSENVTNEVSTMASRSVQDLRKFLADESSNPRRVGGGVSVVQRDSGHKATRPTATVRAAPNANPRDTIRESRRLGTSNSVLLDRAKRFAG